MNPHAADTLRLPDAPHYPGYCRERARWALDEAVACVRRRNVPLAEHYLREYVRYDTEAWRLRQAEGVA